MRWWDSGVRVRAGLVALNALGLGILSTGMVRISVATLAATVLLLIVRSLRSGRPSAEPPLERIPFVAGGLLMGRGFEWSLDAVQETLDRGRPAIRPDHDLVLSDAVLDRHVLILGTTGAGKSRLLELLAVQASARGDAVVVIDPKGDDGLLSRVRKEAGSRFRLFSLPHPERSVSYNPIGRYHDIREVADRVASLLPSSGDALPFRNFGWEIVNAVAKELDGKRPVTFRALKHGAIDRPVRALADRPRDHHLKLASALIPILSKLSTDLLCPREGGLTWDEVDREREVVYFSLGSLLAAETASAVAKTAILDLQSYVGARYAYAKGQGPIWLFIDELGDVATGSLISLLNKSRGAGLRIISCAQTIADLEVALGGKAAAQQILGNAGTVVQFRALSSPDAETFSRLAGERLVRMSSESAAYEPSLMGSGLKVVDDFRARFSESVDRREHLLVPPWLVAQLPVFHFYARWDGAVRRGRVPLLR